MQIRGSCLVSLLVRQVQVSKHNRLDRIEQRRRYGSGVLYAEADNRSCMLVLC